MATEAQRTVLTRIDYTEAFGATRIFGSFRMAISPGKLLLALLMVVLLYSAGRLMDAVWGPSVLPGEFDAYVTAEDEAQFERALTRQRDALATLLINYNVMTPAKARDLAKQGGAWSEAREKLDTHFTEQLKGVAGPRRANLLEQQITALEKHEALRSRGIFATALRIKIDAFSNLVYAAVQFDVGFDQLNPREQTNPRTVIGALRVLTVELPGWLWNVHPWFLAVFEIVALVIWALIGGAISRQAVVEAATGGQVSAGEAVRYAWQRWINYVLAPLLPMVFVALGALVLAVGGFLLMNWPVADILGALLFVVALGIGFVMALIVVLWIGGVHLMYPALSAEGSDALDAVSRGFSYVLGRPWRFIFYSLVALVYGAATYLFVGIMVFLTLYLVHWSSGAWVSGGGEAAAAEASRFELMFARPQFGKLAYVPDYEQLDWSGKVAATILMVWIYATIAVVAAYAISFYFSAYSQIYLLLRKRHDATDLSELYEPPAPEAPAQPDKVEPTSATAQTKDEAGGSSEEKPES